ncbi:MAG: hypothetical protein U9N02_03255 [Campylobacterota bacterium]|nr:hypothetical protein [Campylobacterota bacterium]
MRNSIKKIITLSLAVGMTTALMAKAEVNKADSYNIPIRSIFVSQMMPRFVGTTSMYGYDLKVSQKALDISNEIRPIIIDKLKPKMKKLKQLESKVFDLSLRKGTHNEIVTLLKKISNLKLEASLIQLECIEMYKKQVSKKDFELIKKFLEPKKKHMFKYVKIMK